MFLFHYLCILYSQTFPPSEGYPFPQYIGSCGRFTAAEYVGPTLDKYYDAAWEERVEFSEVFFFIFSASTYKYSLPGNTFSLSLMILVD